MDSIANLLTLAEQYEHRLPEPANRYSPPEGSAIAGWIELTLLKPEVTLQQVKALTDEARQIRFAAVCVNPGFVSLAAGLLANSKVPVSAAIAYPLGASLPSLKVIEALTCLSNGAAEIDMVLNIGALKGEAYGQVLNEMYAVAQVVHNQRAAVTITLEMALLNRRETIIACLLGKAAGADYIKAHTGFGQAESHPNEVDFLNRVVGPEVKVKASGIVESPQAARDLIAAGAARVVTSSGAKWLQDALQ